MGEDQIAGLVQTGVIRSNTMIWREGLPQWVACSEVKPELFAQPQLQGTRQAMPVVGAAATVRQAAATGQYPAQVQPVAGRAHPGTAQMHHGDPNVVREAAIVFARGAGWMKLLGVLALLGGAVLILGVLFALVAGGLSGGGAMLIIAGIIALFYGTMGGILFWQGMLLLQSAGKSQDAARTGQKHSLLAALAANAKFFKIWGVITVVGLVINVFMIFFAIAEGGLAAMSLRSLGGGDEFGMSEFDDPESEKGGDPEGNGSNDNSDGDLDEGDLGEMEDEDQAEEDADGFKEVEEDF